MSRTGDRDALERDKSYERSPPRDLKDLMIDAPIHGTPVGMILRKLFPLLTLPALALGLVLASPSTAEAAEVMCSNEWGECTVSNDGQSWISCSCGDTGGDEGTGGDEFFGLSEEELNAVCLEHLAWCEGFGETGEGGEGTSTSTDGGESTSDSGEEGSSTDEGGTTVGEEGTSTSGEEGTSTSGEEGTSTDGGDGSTTAEGDGSTTAEGDGGTAEGDGSTGDSGEASTGDSGDTNSTGDSGSGSGSDGGTTQGEEGDGGSETGNGGDGGGGAGDEGGQGCSVNPHASGIGLLMLSMLGLLGLRRREENT
jgi:hypothetical protein